LDGISDYAESEGEATATVSFIYGALVDFAPDDAWRRIVPPTARDVVKGGNHLQFLAGSYLCSVGLVVLNRRHLAELPELEDAAPLAEFLEQVADSTFSEMYFNESPGAGHIAKRYQLHRSVLFDSMSSRASWVIKNWDKRKIEGRRRGGRHGAAQGVRKGPPPGLVPGLLADFIHLDPGERRRAFISAHPCSDSTFYKLQRRYLDRLDNPDPNLLEQAELQGLLPITES
jgi:hypothetical protein